MRRARKVKNEDDAVVGIVAAFLIVGLIVAVISVVQTVYIPQWMQEQEANHMENVENQFAQLKYAIDQHMLTRQPGIPITTSITLGSKELPFLMSSRAFGSLTIIPDRCNVNITAKNVRNGIDFSLGIIEYSSANAYYLNQDYMYEAGAVLLSQNQGNTMVIKPNFLVTQEDNIVNISFTIVNISVVAGKSSIGGYGEYPIQTEFSDNATYSIQNISNITINSHYQNAWQIFLNRTLRNEGLNYYGYGKNYTITLSDSGVKVEFTASTIVNLELNVIKIDAQVAPGWIEEVKS